MRVLLDTNIVIHREASTVVNEDIGVLFRWLDNLHYIKCIHPVSIEELNKHRDPKVLKTLKARLANYNTLKTKAPIAGDIRRLSDQLDKDQNDLNDTSIINELYNNRVDVLITEDKKLLNKASLLGIADRVYTIDAFLEKVTAENPKLADYKVLAVQKEHLGNLDILDEFFDALKEDYPGFDKWFNEKADEEVYVCRSKEKLIALLYLKVEDKKEDYSDIHPEFSKKKRLKIGTFKVELNGFRLGERFLKIVFDNALRFHVDEIYVTTFRNRIEQQRLINLLEEFGFHLHGYKHSPAGKEYVYVRPFARVANRNSPKLTYPFFSADSKFFIVPIYPEYHTELLPDSILRTESPNEFVENEPHRNAISKVYISRSIERDLLSGDVIVFYRTGGLYKSVLTTIGIVENIIDNIPSEADFVRLCRKRSVFSDRELSDQWNYKPSYRPFIVNFLYAYSFPKRINLQRLIEIGIIPTIHDVPRGFTRIKVDNLRTILKECQADENIIVD
jgi:predicted nucleic acid-binding protein